MVQGEARSVTDKQRLDFAALNRGIKRKASTSSASSSDTETPKLSLVLNMDADRSSGRDEAEEDDQALGYPLTKAMNQEQQKSQLDETDEIEETVLDEDEMEAEFEAQYDRISLPSDDPGDPLNAPEHYDAIIKHYEQRLRYHSHQALQDFYEILRYRKLAGRASDPVPGGTIDGEKSSSGFDKKDSLAFRKWRLCEVHETEVAMDMKFKTSLNYNNLLKLMFGKQEWEGETDLDKLIDDADVADGSMEDSGSNPLDELD